MDEKKGKVTDFPGSGPIELGDEGHWRRRMDSMFAELARRYLILERRCLALEGRGLPLKVGEASRHLPVLDEILDGLRRDMDLPERVAGLEARVRLLEEGRYGGSPQEGVTEDPEDPVTRARNAAAERQRRYRERQKILREGGNGEPDTDARHYESEEEDGDEPEPGA